MTWTSASWTILGWGLHIDGWEYADSIEKKRWLIKNFYDWHRLKGTEAGLEMFLAGAAGP
jgi:P2-related tail formation protein